MMDERVIITGAYISSRGVIWRYKLIPRYDNVYSCERWRIKYDEVGKYTWRKEFYPNKTSQVTAEFEKLVSEKYGIRVVY